MVSGGWLIAALALLLAPAPRHPMHTSSAELVQEADSLRVAIRVFVDDIAAVGPMRAYFGAHFGIVDRQGQAVPLQWASSDVEGDVLTIRMHGSLAGGLSGARLHNLLLTDRFADQVNIVRAAYGGRTATLIFTRGDGPKTLP